MVHGGLGIMSKKNKQEKEQEIPEMPEESVEAADESPVSEEKITPLEALEKKNAELNDRYLRLMAEYENYRKRSTKEKSEIYPQAMANAVEKFLPVLDNLDRASGFERTTDEFAQGFDMICQSFSHVLESIGVEQFGQAGEPFDPTLHNAVMHTEDPELGSNVVAQVLQKGYKIGDRVIRCAMVQVAN